MTFNEKKYPMYESELEVRPDDIDMNNHVHFSKYLDYVLAARYEQLKKYYKMSMEEFIAMGYTWYVKKCEIEYKRALSLGDKIIIRTGIYEINEATVKVKFEILKKENRKISAEGLFEYSLINLKTNRAEKIPQFIIDHYNKLNPE